MANVISLQFNDKALYPEAKYTFSSNQDTNGIFYALGSDFGNAAWANPSGEYTTSGTGGAGPLTNMTNRVYNSGNYTLDDTEYGQLILNDYLFLPTRVYIAASSNTGGGALTGVSILDNAGNPVQLASFTSPSGGSQDFNVGTNTDIWTDTIRITNINGSAQVYVYEIEIYGKLRRKDGEDIALFTPAVDFQNYVDAAISPTGTGRLIRYEDGFFKSYNDTKFFAARAVLTGNVTFDNNAVNMLYTYDPNGADRDIVLPQAPRIDQYIRIVSIDGNNKLNIKETAAGPVVVDLSNSTGNLTAECIWEAENSVWHITV